MSKSTARPRRRKADRPKKPYSEFPLTPHASGKWMKKVRGTIRYSGNWARWVHGVLDRTPGGAPRCKGINQTHRVDILAFAISKHFFARVSVSNRGLIF